MSEATLYPKSPDTKTAHCLAAAASPSCSLRRATPLLQVPYDHHCAQGIQGNLAHKKPS